MSMRVNDMHGLDAVPHPLVTVPVHAQQVASARHFAQLLARFWRNAAWFMLAGCALGAAAHAGVVPELALKANTKAVELAPFVSYHHDPGGEHTVAEAFALLAADQFAPLPDGNAAFGFQPGAFWFHVRLINRGSALERWLLVQKYALSDHLDLYVRYPDGRIAHEVGGDMLPFKARAIRYRHPNFWVELPRGVPVDVLLRVESQSSMQVPLALYTPARFTEISRDAQFGIGIYYGILLALFFYNLVIWLSLRDPSYGWYLLHLSAFGLVLFTLNGLGFEYLWSNSTWLADKSVPLAICLAQIGMQQFARSFLDVNRIWRAGDIVGLVMIGFFVVLGIAATQLPYRISTPIASAAVFASILWIAVEAIVVLRRGYKPARLFLLAWSMFLLGTAVFAAVAFGLLPNVFVTEYGVQIGSALEMLLLSVALGYRYSRLRNENERIVRESRLQLERKVEQRTRELRTALVQLERAHSQLSESNRRDGLTGLYNRGYFRERLLQMLDQAQEQRAPLALLMIDLDHFKLVNDRYGHLVGDECLRRCAQVMGRVLRPFDALLARIGGEEFMVALPGMQLPAAVELAETLRAGLREHRWDQGTQEQPITASIGVHAVDIRGERSLDDAMESVDRALYRAKADGRDCVRTLRAA